MNSSAALRPFVDGTRYIALGDSITHVGWYTLYIDLFYQTRFPGRKIEIIDGGLYGDKAEDGLRRYDWDIAANQPTVVSIMFGMNDVNRDLYSPASQGATVAEQRAECIVNWRLNTRLLIERLKKDNVVPILLTPSIFDDASTMATPNFPGCNSGLGEMARGALEMAREENVGVVDFHHPMVALGEKIRNRNPMATVIGPDRIHPGRAGHLYMAYLFLMAQGVAREVPSFSIDVRGGILTGLPGCRVLDVKAGAGKLTFTYCAGALPFPIDPEASEALVWEPAINELNREVMTILNLGEGTYDLTVDGLPFRSYTAQELAGGVNLAAEPGLPQCRQAREVFGLINEKWELIRVFRSIALGDSWARGLTRPFTLEQMEPFLLAKIDETAKGPWAKAVAEDVANYRANKGRENEVRGRIATIIPKIRRAAQPQPRIIRLRRK